MVKNTKCHRSVFVRAVLALPPHFTLAPPKRVKIYKKRYVGFSGMACVLSMCLVSFAVSVTLVNAQTGNTPESQTKDFYSWYLKAMVRGKDPTKDKKVTSSYLSVRFSRWYYSKAGQNSEADVFINSQEWSDAWADNIEVGTASITGNKAALQVRLTSPPEEFVMKLQVSLTKEGGKWKIDRVRSLVD
jgi:hypothetical protein